MEWVAEEGTPRPLTVQMDINLSQLVQLALGHLQLLLGQLGQGRGGHQLLLTTTTGQMGHGTRGHRTDGAHELPHPRIAPRPLHDHRPRTRVLVGTSTAHPHLHVLASGGCCCLGGRGRLHSIARTRLRVEKVHSY